MGMAASQARYLGLTARKINVEYEGQQVNQQRTALANESAGLFRRLLTLEVPTAPSQADYYTEEYTYNDPSSADGKVTIKSITENPDSQPTTYTVVTSYKETVPQYNSIKDQQVSVVGDTGKIQLSNGNQFDLEGPISGLGQADVDEFNKAMGITDPNDPKYNSADDTYYRFTNTANNTTYYINASTTMFDPSDNQQSTQVVDFLTKMPVDQEVTKTIDNATLGTTSSGLYNSIYWTDEDGTHSYSLTQGQSYDEVAYNDAMAQYNYDKSVYDKEIADINAKTEELQQTDRTLELRLKQLDTEQEALQTELDSVKKVIDTNVDNVFKTFQ